MARSNLANKIAIGIILFTVVTTSYFLYFWFQTRQFVQQIMPVYQTLDQLAQDQQNLETQSRQKVPADALRDYDRIQGEAQTIKAQLAAMHPATSRSEQVVAIFLKATDKLLDWNQAAKASLLAETAAQSAPPDKAAEAAKLSEETKAQCTTASTEYQTIIRTQLSRMLGLRR